MAQPIAISYQFTDDVGRVMTAQVFIPSTTTFANTTDYAEALGALIYEVCDAQITEASVTFPIDVAALATSRPVAGSDNRRGALLSFDINDSQYRWTMRIPAFRPDLFSGKNEINESDTDVQALTDAIGVSLTVNATPVGATDEKGLALLSFLSGQQSVRRK